MSARTAEPVDRVRLPWVLTVTLVNLGTFAAFFGPLQALLPAQAKAFDPDNKETVLAVVAGIGAAVSLVCNPLFGALSDRTTSRHGRRAPWILGGTVVGALGLLLLATANGIVVMILGWCLVQAAVNASLAAITAVLPDRVPISQRASPAATSASVRPRRPRRRRPGDRGRWVACRLCRVRDLPADQRGAVPPPKR